MTVTENSLAVSRRTEQLEWQLKQKLSPEKTGLRPLWSEQDPMKAINNL